MIEPLEDFIYIILGIDELAQDHILAVCLSYEDAKRNLIDFLSETEYYDLWIEKHRLV